jgi:hypothetical protein
MLKGAKTSLWIRQIQLGLGGLVIGTIGAYSQDGAIIAKNGFFQVGLGFGVWGLGFRVEQVGAIIAKNGFFQVGLGSKAKKVISSNQDRSPKDNTKWKNQNPISLSTPPPPPRCCLQGYTNFIWMVVCINSLGGLLVAVVVKYTDNIAKAFAVSVSIVLSSFISVPLFGIPITLLFMIGTGTTKTLESTP